MIVRGYLVLLAAAFVLLNAARVNAACSISTTGASFGSYNVYDTTPVDSTATVTYNCGVGTLTVAIDFSKGSSSTFNPRTMTSGANTLSYNLYTDAARASIWGDGSAGTSRYSTVLPVPNTDVVTTAYGRIPASQDAAAGSYNDTIVVTVNF